MAEGVQHGLLRGVKIAVADIQALAVFSRFLSARKIG